jgi:hypothetical protein
MGAKRLNWWDDAAIFKAIAPHKPLAFMQRPELMIRRCSYLGGLSGNEEHVVKGSNTIRIKPDGIEFVYLGSAYPKVLMQIPWSEVAGLEIQGGDEIESPALGGRRLAGGLLSRTSQKQKTGAIFEVTTTDDYSVSFRTASMTFRELSETLAPLLQAIDTARRATQLASIGSRDAEPASAPNATAVPVSLRELSDLHEQGALTDEEFAAAKRRVIES